MRWVRGGDNTAVNRYAGMRDALGLARHRGAGSLYERLAVNILEDF